VSYDFGCRFLCLPKQSSCDFDCRLPNSQGRGLRFAEMFFAKFRHLDGLCDGSESLSLTACS
jgi:hypothetical protein